MELFLNFAWGLLAVVIVCLWLRLGRRTVGERHLSFVALIMLIVILFPVISVSDDLWAIQNPARRITRQRRDHRAASPHSTFPAVAALPETADTGMIFGIMRVGAPRQVAFFAIENPAFNSSSQNRPPPAA